MSAREGRPRSLGVSAALVLVCVTMGAVSALELRHMSVSHGLPLPWSVVLSSTLPRWALLAAVLPLALRLARRLPPSSSVVAASAHLGLFLVVSLAHAGVVTRTQAIVTPGVVHFPFSARLLRAWFGGLPVMVSLYGALFAAAWALREAGERERRSLRASQLEARLRAADLAVLRARLRPHFLYNTLHGIAALAADDEPSRAVPAIEHLSELLHASLRDDGREVVSLEEEVGLAERYLALQGMRFGERLGYRLEIAPDLADLPVPVLLLQPLVENAVVHGLDDGRERLSVGIGAVRCGSAVVLTVEDDGTAAGADANRAGQGLGLSATRARLAAAYGESASLEMSRRQGGGTVVRILIPAVEPAGGPAVPRSGEPALSETTP